jgi:hypothetical protein
MRAPLFPKEQVVLWTIRSAGYRTLRGARCGIKTSPLNTRIWQEAGGATSPFLRAYFQRIAEHCHQQAGGNLPSAQDRPAHCHSRRSIGVDVSGQSPSGKVAGVDIGAFRNGRHEV